MKTKIKLLFNLSFMVILTFNSFAQVGINNNGSSPNSSAMLDVESTEKGFLPPRMTTAQRDGISSPQVGLMIFNTDDNCIQFYVNPGFWQSSCFYISDDAVVNPQTGVIWMDRNLGATRVATSSTDSWAYGDLYQWGRAADGHQIRTSSTTSTLSSTNNPSNGNFITTNGDWRSPKNANLWQGVNGINNPCPYGYRLPTQAEWNAEISSWSTKNAAGAFASPLKLPMAGVRSSSNGSLSNAGSNGRYWSSTIDGDGTSSRRLGFDATVAGTGMGRTNRASGLSIRCLMD